MKKHEEKYIKFYLTAIVVFLLTVVSIFLIRDQVYDVDMCIVRFLAAFIVLLGGHYLFVVKKLRLPVKKMMIAAGILLGTAGISCLISIVCVKNNWFRELSYPFLLFVFGVVLIAVLLLLYLKDIISDAFLLAAIVLIVGSIYAFSYPDANLVSWDDQTHYERTVIVSHFNMDNAPLSEADRILINSAYQRAAGLLPNNEARAFSDVVNETYLTGEKYRAAYDQPLYGQPLSYLPSALMLLLGRGLCFQYSTTFTLGRWANTLFYSLLVFLALHRLKSGKLIFFVISMFPTTLVLMSDYSYDTWGLGFTLLSFALWLEVMQSEQVGLTPKRLTAICLLFALSCAAKPVYFLMILVFLLTPASKLDDSLNLKTVRIVIILTAVLLAASFVIPFMSSGAGGNDYRGGSDVNSFGQVQYILSNPLTYAGVLLNFLKGYWVSGYYVYSLAYLGTAPHSFLVLLPMLLIAFLDKSDADRIAICFKNSAVSFLLAFATSALIATSLYVSFTPVGLDEVHGCQPRYLLPLLPFVAYFLGGCRIAEAAKKMVPIKAIVVVTAVYMAVYSCSAIYNHCLLVF